MNAPAPPATSASDIAVEARGLCKTFRQRQRSEKLSQAFTNLFRPQVRLVEALREVDLTVRRGEIIAYAGPNGAGKSTTVKILSGILAPDAGQVRVLGLDPIADRVRYVARIGVVFGQRTELWWDHPVAASYEWKRVVWEIPRPRYERMLGQVRELLGLGEFFHSLTRELSLGQRMRADLGLALLHEPEILFLDEPTIGVDVLAKRHILEFILELNRTRQVTVMLTSHDMDELEQLAGRIVLIDRGRLAFDGDFDQLRRRFADRRRLRLQTQGEQAPQLQGAELLGSEGGWYEYRFDAGRTEIVALLEEARSHSPVLDVETHRAPIDEVIADLYQQWRQ
ncbi:MAG: ATP-binding cassette domain-containing protein [Candidatus Latescibacteria bacterium]|nr:ATP-binding cassette domain-containing protein [Candidatus Latescibacterota bacterium]